MNKYPLQIRDIGVKAEAAVDDLKEHFGETTRTKAIIRCVESYMWTKDALEEAMEEIDRLRARDRLLTNIATRILENIEEREELFASLKKQINP